MVGETPNGASFFLGSLTVGFFQKKIRKGDQEFFNIRAAPAKGTG